MPKGVKSLKDVAKVFKDKALTSINPGVPYDAYKTGKSKAYKTGNLFKNVASSNRIDTMFKVDETTEKYTLNFNIAPTGATYGKFVHDGTRYMGKRPYAQLAAESPEVQAAINEYMNNKVNEKLDGLFDIFDKKAEKAGLEVD